MAERDRLKLGEPVAAADAAEEDRQFVADQFAAKVGETVVRLIRNARYYWLLLADENRAKKVVDEELSEKSRGKGPICWLAQIGTGIAGA